MSGDRGAVQPVFVDPSGRRQRALQRICWVLAGLMTAYVAVVILSLLGPPGLSRLNVPGLGPVLPGPGAAPLGNGTGGRQAPGRVLPSAVRPSPSPITGSAQPTATRSATVAPTSAARTPSVGAPSTTSASPSTGATATGPPTGVARPGPTRTPPGQATSDPSPRSTRTPPRPSRSPRA